MRQLLWIITETINTLFPVVTFSQCVVAEVVLFSIVAFKTLIFHQAYLRCGGIFSDSIVSIVLRIQKVKISLKIGQYLMKLRRIKLRRTKKFASFWDTLYTVYFIYILLAHIADIATYLSSCTHAVTLCIRKL